MRPIVLLGLCVMSGCEPGDLPFASVADISDPLAEFSEHTEIVQLGRAWLSLDGEASRQQLGDVDGGYGPKAVLDQTEDRVQILQDVPFARVMLWLDTEDLGVWADGGRGAGRPGGDTSEAFVRFDAKRTLRTVDTSGPHRLVTSYLPMNAASFGAVKVTAWFPANRLTPSYADLPEEPPFTLAPPAWLRQDIAILDAPGGEPLVQLNPPWNVYEDRFPIPVEWLEIRDEHVLVRLLLDGGEVRGWVPEQDVSFERRQYRMYGGRGTGCGFLRGVLPKDGPRLTLPVGVLLHDLDGLYIGETTGVHDWLITDEEDDWTGVEVQTPWGALTAWVGPE